MKPRMPCAGGGKDLIGHSGSVPAGRSRALCETTAPKKNNVQVLARASGILRLLGRTPNGLAQFEIAESLGLAYTTTNRILSALHLEGFIERIGLRGRYILSREFVEMANVMRRAQETVIHAHLEILSEDIDETVDFSVLERGRLIIVDQVFAPHRLTIVSATASVLPVHCTASGKALLAAIPPFDAERLIGDKLSALTPNTITSIATLRNELESVRRTGIAYDNEEHCQGICAVAVAVRGTPLGLGAIGVPIPAQRIERVNRRYLQNALLSAAARIEAEFRHGPAVS